MARLDDVTARFNASADVIRSVGASLAGPIDLAVEMVIESLRAGGTVYVFGNGGSAADAQHIAGELVGRFLLDLPHLADRGAVTRRDGVFDIKIVRGNDGRFHVGVRAAGRLPLEDLAVN